MAEEDKPPLKRSDSQDSTSDAFASPDLSDGGGTAFKDSNEGNEGAASAPAPSTGEEEGKTPKLPSTATTDDNATLAALAASSPVSSPLIPGPSGKEDELDPNTPSFMLVASLRSQVTDLTSQVNGLNNKLVKSYTRFGELEDEVHERGNTISRFKARVVELEKDKESWEKEIAVGGWVERDHVQGEMQRLMAKAMEETKSRQTAVEAHSKLETEIENLTSSLFTEANRMVAVERFARARAEEKMKSLEESGAVMTGLFEELQTNLRETVERLEKREADVVELKKRVEAAGGNLNGLEGEESVEGSGDGGTALFSDGDKVIVDPSAPTSPLRAAFLHQSIAISPKLITSVLPYTEFINFVTYLRQLRVTVLSRPYDNVGHPQPYISSSATARGFGLTGPLTPGGTSSSSSPSQQVQAAILTPTQLLSPHLPLSTHLSQPFLKRCIEEDSDPSLRLDLAPGLGFLSRRNVSSAVVDGTLLIEPIYAGSTLPSSTCTLCGNGLERWWTGNLNDIGHGNSMTATIAKTNVAQVNQAMRKVLGGGGWSLSTFTNAGRSSTPPPGANNSNATKAIQEHFSLPSSQTSPTPNSAPTSPVTPHPTNPSDNTFNFPPPPSTQQIHIFRINDTSTSRYPICPTYCLPRLRAVCEFWTYVRAMERGLLLEEGFQFVGTGMDGSGLGTGSGKGSVSSLVMGRSKSSLVALKSTEDLVEKKEESVKEEPTVEKDEVVKEEAAGGKNEEEEEKSPEAEKAEDKVNEDSKHEPDSTKAESTPSGLAVPDSTGADGIMKNANHSATSLNKVPPPLPKRSAARHTPTLGSSEFSPPSRPHSPNPAQSPATPTTPKNNLPPPPPRRNINGGSKATELGGAVDASDIVGGATGWEDRCWTEIVRLKESVFWTRVAAVGNDGESVPTRSYRVEQH